MTTSAQMTPKQIEYYNAHKEDLNKLYLKYLKSKDTTIKLRASDFIINLIPDEDVPQ